MEPNVCKIFVFEHKNQRVLKPRNITCEESFSRYRKAHSTKRNLFGCPDPEDLQKMIDEQSEIDRQRFLDRFGFDITHIENLNNVTGNGCDNQENVGAFGKSRKLGKVMNKGRVIKSSSIGQRKAFRQCNSSNSKQAVLTDFYKVKKTQANVEKKEDAKEN